jgi:hypothetical protein
MHAIDLLMTFIAPHPQPSWPEWIASRTGSAAEAQLSAR